MSLRYLGAVRQASQTHYLKGRLEALKERDAPLADERKTVAEGGQQAARDAVADSLTEVSNVDVKGGSVHLGWVDPLAQSAFRQELGAKALEVLQLSRNERVHELKLNANAEGREDTVRDTGDDEDPGDPIGAKPN